MHQASSGTLHYDRPTIWFHWTVAFLVPLQWIGAALIDWFPQGLPRIEARSIHIGLGILLGFAIAARIVWRQQAAAFYRLLIKALCIF